MRKSGYDISMSVTVCLLFCTWSHAQSAPFKWTSIDVDIVVQDNGDLVISERQEYLFAPDTGKKRHECYRLFVTDRIDDIRDFEVYELADDRESQSKRSPVAFSLVTDQNDLRICWSCKVNPLQKRIFLLEYVVTGAIYVGNYKSRRAQRAGKTPMDELYWNAVMWPRPAPVEQARVTVHLPSRLRGKNRRITSFGTTASLRENTDADTAGFDSWREIPPESGLQIYVGFQHGVLKIDRPNWQPKGPSRWRLPSKNVMIVLAVFATVSVCVESHRRRCPYCGKIWGLKYTGERENLNAGKIYWFLRDDIWLYKCKACDYKEWKRRPSGGC